MTSLESLAHLIEYTFNIYPEYDESRSYDLYMLIDRLVNAFCMHYFSDPAFDQRYMTRTFIENFGSEETRKLLEKYPDLVAVYVAETTRGSLRVIFTKKEIKVEYTEADP